MDKNEFLSISYTTIHGGAARHFMKNKRTNSAVLQDTLLVVSAGKDSLEVIAVGQRRLVHADAERCAVF